MAAADQSSSMGAVIYFGLIGLTLISAGPSDVRYLNPQKTMRQVSFEASPIEAHIVDPFSWPVASQSIDRRLALASLQVLPEEEVDQVLAAPGPAAVRPTIDGYLPNGFPRPLGSLPVSLVTDVSDRQIPANRSDLLSALPALPNPPVVFSADQAPLPHPVSLTEHVTVLAAPLPSLSFHSAFDNYDPFDVAGPAALYFPTIDAWDGLNDAAWPGVTIGDRVNLRADPSLTGEVLDLVSIGSDLIVTQSRGEWVKVDIGTQSGWMFAEFIDAR